MKRILAWMLFTAMLLPGMAVGAQNESGAPEVAAPAFVSYNFETEVGGLLSLKFNITQEAGGLFVLEDGYLSVGYEQEDDVISPFPAGKPLTCLNGDLSVRWVLEDERLAGAWYTDLLELPDALLLGSERSPADVGQIYSLMMVEKDTGAVRWQIEGKKRMGDGLLYIGPCRADENGNILVGSNGDLRGNQDGAGTLSLLNAADGSVLWTKEYQTEYGMIMISDICPLGDGWLISGRLGERGEDAVILYAGPQWVTQGYFILRSEAESYHYVPRRLIPASEDVVYLGGWEWELNAEAGKEENPTLYMMRITQDAFID